MNYKFSIKAALKYGFGATLDNILLIIKVFITYLALWILGIVAALFAVGISGFAFFSSMMPQLMQGCQSKEQCSTLAMQVVQGVQALPWLWLIVVGFAFYLVLFALGIGLWRILIEMYDTGTSSLGQLFSCFSLVPKIFVASMLYSVMILGGFLLLIIPGIYLMMRCGYYWYLIVDKNSGIIESFKESYRATEGSVWRLIIFSVVCSFVMFAAKPVALLFVLPIVWLAQIYVYRMLVPKA